MSCTHTPAYPTAGNMPSQQAAASACTIVDKHGALTKNPRAVTIPEGNRTLIEQTFWESMGPVQRAAVVSHERAHVVIGLDVPCESCADKVGGYMMRMWGYSDAAIASGYDTLRVPHERQIDGTFRDAARGAVEGAKHAGRGIAARGLQGTHTLDPHQQALIEAKRKAKQSSANLRGEKGNALDNHKPTGAALAVTKAFDPGPPQGLTEKETALHPPVREKQQGTGQATLPPPDKGPPQGLQNKLRERDAHPNRRRPNRPDGSGGPPVIDHSKDPQEGISKELKTQIIAGVVVAIVMAFVLGKG